MPVGRLVLGPLESVDDLQGTERFVRTAVLHDDIYIHRLGHREKWENDYVTVLKAIAPGSLDARIHDIEAMPAEPLRIAPALVKYASDYASKLLEDSDVCEVLTDSERADLAGEYVWSIGEVVWTLRHGGSALLSGPFGSKLIGISQQYPKALFRELDQSWKNYAQQAPLDGLTLTVPPLLGIVLTRCARRDAIPAVIRDLRDEWAEARNRIWDLLDALLVCRSLSEAVEIRKELADAGKLFSPDKTEHDTRPLRVLWEIVAGGAAGAGIAALSGGRLGIGAVSGAMAQAARNLPAFTHEFGAMLFGRGAFDLARRVRRGVSQVEFDALPRLLSDTEKEKLGFK